MGSKDQLYLHGIHVHWRLRHSIKDKRNFSTLNSNTLSISEAKENISLNCHSQVISNEFNFYYQSCLADIEKRDASPKPAVGLDSGECVWS